jgi:hypothetical protein
MDSIPNWHLLCKTGRPTWGELSTDLLRVSPVASLHGIACTLWAEALSKGH